MNDGCLMSSSIVCGNELWVSASSFNGWFCWNLKENRIVYQGVFEEELVYGQYAQNLYSKIYFVNNNLIFVPHNAMEFAKYNFAEAKMRKCKFKIRYDTEYIGIPFYGSTEMDGKIYEIICYRNVADVICYDIEGNQAEVLEDFTQYLANSRNSVDARYAMASYEGYLYALEVGTSLLIEYNVKTRDCKSYSLFEYGKKYINLTAVENGIFLIAENGKEVMGKRIDDNFTIEAVCWETEEHVNLYGDVSLQCEKSRVYTFLDTEEYFICYDLKEKIISKIGVKDIRGEKIWGYCINSQEDNIYAYSSTHIFKIGIRTGHVEKTEISIDKVMMELLERMYMGEKCVVEDSERNLENYLQYIKGKED